MISSIIGHLNCSYIIIIRYSYKCKDYIKVSQLKYIQFIVTGYSYNCEDYIKVIQLKYIQFIVTR